VDKYISNSLLRVLTVGAVCTGLLYLFAIRDPYYHAESGCEWPPRPFKVVVPWREDGRMSLIQGVKLAEERLKSGRVKKRGVDESPEVYDARKKARALLADRIKVEYVNEPEYVAAGNAVAHEIVADGDVLAVIGHERSAVAVASAVTYEKHNILYLSPKATLARLTRHRFKYTFPLVPSDDAFAKTLAEFAVQKRWSRIGIIYGRFEGGETLAREFALHHRELLSGGPDPISMSDSRRPPILAFFRSYLPSPKSGYEGADHREMLEEISRFKIDALLLADQFPWAAKMLKDMRTMGINKPIFGGELLDSSQAWRLAGRDAEGLFVASAVDPQSDSKNFDAFAKDFKEKNDDRSPGYGSSQGYQAFNLLVQAIIESECTNPIVLAITLRTGSWKGLFGTYTFDDNNAILGHDVVVKQVVEDEGESEGVSTGEGKESFLGKFETVFRPRYEKVNPQ
jgi:branched-chain amino acid transport system substrate-binding protein